MSEIFHEGVAVVDDDVDLVRSYELIFRKKQVPVVFVAYDGKSALEKFRAAEARPGSVIVDYRMPVIGGLELMGEIKKIEPGTRVIFISADDSVEQDALAAGADAFLKKPVGIRAILESVGRDQTN